MERKRAIELAIQSIRAEVQRLAVDANLHEQFRAGYPAAVRASKRRKQLREAIEILTCLREELES